MVACARCGVEAPERARYCAGCGTALAPPASVMRERKLVSVLFCDLVGFTALSDGSDPEDVRAIVEPYWLIARTAIEHFGGTVEKYVGDAVMAVFGAPVAREDDPQRAVLAALEIAGAVAAVPRAGAAAALGVRVGICTGETLVVRDARVAEGEAIVSGDAVNTAARLQSVARAGTVLVCAVTRSAVQRRFALREQPAIAAKGKAIPVPAWEVDGLLADCAAAAPDAARASFVGRERELAWLAGLLDDVAASRRPRLVTLVGDPGIGKTRVANELRSTAAGRRIPLEWRSGRCLPYGDGVTFWAIGEIVKAHAGILESDPPAVASARLEAAIPADLAGRDWLIGRLRPLAGLSGEPPAERGEIGAAWRRFLELLTAAGPAVVHVEDIHWADAAVIELLAGTGDMTGELPLLVLCTTRPELIDRHPAWPGEGERTHVLRLQGLETTQVSRIVAERLGLERVPGDVTQLVLARAAGNPLFVEELVSMLVERRLIIDTGAGPQLSDEAVVETPHSVHAVIAARLDALPLERKAVVQIASVVGRTFWPGALAEAGGLERSSVERELEALARDHLVLRVRVSSMQDEAELVFSHQLVRDEAYGQIPRALRSRYHLAVAAWIERQAGERVAEVAELLATHHLEALALAQAAHDAEGAARIAARTEGLLLIAGERALALDAARAVTLLEHALELAAPGSRSHARAARRLAHAYDLGGRRAEARPMWELAIAGLSGAGETLEAAEATLTMSAYVKWEGDLVRARELVEGALALAGHEHLALRGRALAELADHALMHDRWSEGAAFADEALACARAAGDARLAVTAGGARATARFMDGDPAALEEMRAALAAARELGLADEVAMFFNNFGCMLCLVSERDALAVFAEAEAYLEACGQTASAMYVAGNAWSARKVVRDRTGEQIVHGLTREIERGRDVGQHWAVATAEVDLAFELVHLGDDAEAATLLTSLLPTLRELEHSSAPDALVLIARLSARRGDIATARGRLIEAAAIEPDAGGWSFVPERTALVAFALEIGERDLAERYVALFRPPVHPVERREHHACAALLSEARRDYTEAVTLYQAAAEAAARQGAAARHAELLLGLGRTLRELADPTAAQHLREARDAFRRFGWGPWASAAERCLDLCGAIAD